MKEKFLKEEFPRLLSILNASAKGSWGVMNAQQMVEHMSDYVRIASGKDKYELSLTPEQSQKAYSFMMTDKPFRENTPNHLLPEIPPAWRNGSMQAASEELEKEMADFFSVYKNEPGLRVMNPFFGMLGYEEQLHLLHKHATHHARQFALIV